MPAQERKPYPIEDVLIYDQHVYVGAVGESTTEAVRAETEANLATAHHRDMFLGDR